MPVGATARSIRSTRGMSADGVQMTWLRPAFAILIAIFGSTADAGSQAVPRKYQAGFYLEGCKDFLAGRSNFLSGRCVGAIEVLSELGTVGWVGAAGPPLAVRQRSRRKRNRLPRHRRVALIIITAVTVSIRESWITVLLKAARGPTPAARASHDGVSIFLTASSIF